MQLHSQVADTSHACKGRRGRGARPGAQGRLASCLPVGQKDPRVGGLRLEPPTYVAGSCGIAVRTALERGLGGRDSLEGLAGVPHFRWGPTTPPGLPPRLLLTSPNTASSCLPPHPPASHRLNVSVPAHLALPLQQHPLPAHLLYCTCGTRTQAEGASQPLTSSLPPPPPQPQPPAANCWSV